MATTVQATWGGRFRGGPSALMLAFSESVSFDKRLAPYDILGSQAHAAMLHKVGILTRAERDAIHAGLSEVGRRIAAGEFTWSVEFEDVHMNIERALLAITPAAAKLHTGRSRNDQVATDVRLFLRDACAQLERRLLACLATLARQARAHASIHLPGYTHLQRGQPVSAGHHLLAWAAMLERDLRRVRTVHDSAGECPLGSGALAGSTLPLDRAFTAKRLGFVDARGRPRVTSNSMDAVADRDAHTEFLAACALCGVHLSRIAEDLVLWSTPEFRFIVFPEEFSTGSSLMPQKRNPDAAELLRGKAARLAGHLQTLLGITKGLPLTYNRDLQDDKPPLFDAFDQLALALEVLEAVCARLAFRADACAAAVADPLLLATDLADWLVLQGVPFRDAHHAVGALVKLSEDSGVPLPELDDTAVRDVRPELADATWRSVFDVSRAMRVRTGPGMPSPANVRREAGALARRAAKPPRLPLVVA
jgi:argininosuccinate lyase